MHTNSFSLSGTVLRNSIQHLGDSTMFTLLHKSRASLGKPLAITISAHKDSLPDPSILINSTRIVVEGFQKMNHLFNARSIDTAPRNLPPINQFYLTGIAMNDFLTFINHGVKRLSALTLLNEDHGNELHSRITLNYSAPVHFFKPGETLFACGTLAPSPDGISFRAMTLRHHIPEILHDTAISFTPSGRDVKKFIFAKNTARIADDIDISPLIKNSNYIQALLNRLNGNTIIADDRNESRKALSLASQHRLHLTVNENGINTSSLTLSPLDGIQIRGDRNAAFSFLKRLVFLKTANIITQEYNYTPDLNILRQDALPYNPSCNKNKRHSDFILVQSSWNTDINIDTPIPVRGHFKRQKTANGYKIVFIHPYCRNGYHRPATMRTIFGNTLHANTQSKSPKQ